MPPTNLIVNGTFDAGSSGWSGNDTETSYRESAYLGNGSSNRVAEMDGRSGQTTIMEQSFTVENPTATELTFDSALRTASNSNEGSEGFTVEILDSDGVSVASTTVLPTSNSLTSFSLPVNFPSEGTYTVRLTELGPDDSLGAIVDNIELMVCFRGSTTIQMPKGGKPARDILVGDVVDTARGPKLVRWTGHRSVSADDIAHNEKLLPVKISSGSLGCGLPLADLWVSRQHRIQVTSPICKRMFGCQNALVSAISLTALPGIYVDSSVHELDYVHILLDAHEILFAEGAPSESLLLGDEAEQALSTDALDEIHAIFGDLPGDIQALKRTTEYIPKGHQQKKLVARINKNNRPALENFGAQVSDT